MKKYSLTAEPRKLTGRKVKELRRQGLLPASIYGRKIKSLSVSVKLTEFDKVYEEAGESGLVELKTEGDKVSAGLPAGRQVLIHNVQRDPVSGLPLHVELYQVDLKEKVKARVPVETVGEAPAVKEKQGVLLTILDEVEVEALPTDLPEKLEVDVSSLSAVDQEVKVSELKVPKAVTILTDPGLTIVKIGPLITKEAEAEAAAEAAAAAAAEAAAAAATEGPAAAEGAPPPPEAGAEGTPPEKPAPPATTTPGEK